MCPDPTWGFVDVERVINPPGRNLVGPPVLYQKPEKCPLPDHSTGPSDPPPCPEAVSADDPGMTSVNYRNEPIALRISTPHDEQTAGRPGDLSFAYATRRDRARPEYNVFPYAPDLLPLVTYDKLTKGLRRGDPFTPLLRAYEGDRVIMRILTGAHEEEHNFTVHGMKWLFEPERPDSGWRNSQNMGISEWFDFVIPRMPSLRDGEFADFLYKPTAAAEWQWNGAWGLFRLYRGPKPGTESDRGVPTSPEDPEDTFAPGDLDTDDESLVVLKDQNADARADGDTGLAEVTVAEANAEEVVLHPDEREAGPTEKIRIACPAISPADQRPASLVTYDIVAVAAKEALQNDPFPSLVYNSRHTGVAGFPERVVLHGPLHDPTAIMFVHREDLVFVGGRPRLKPTVRREPLVLRARAGDCIRVTLTNLLPDNYADLDGWNAVPMIIEGFNANDVEPSLHVSLHPQLVAYDVRRADGSNAGLNPRVYGRQTVKPNESKTFFWYAGDLKVGDTTITPIPIEFGSTGLSSADPIKHSNKGAVGAMIIEPAGATWTFDTMDEWVPFQAAPAERTTRASASVNVGNSGFKEFVLIFQDNVNLRYAEGPPVESLAVNEDATESAQKAVNYKTEPIWFRKGRAPDTPMEQTREETDFHLVLSNGWIGRDPDTPVFEAVRNKAVRFRLVHPGGHTQAHVFDLHGHIWEELPYVNNSLAARQQPGLGVAGGTRRSRPRPTTTRRS